MLNIASQPTIMKSVFESTDSGLELADSSTDSDAHPAKVGMWVRALIVISLKGNKNS